MMLKIDTSIPFKVGVKKRDIAEPALLMFLIIAFYDTL